MRASSTASSAALLSLALLAGRAGAAQITAIVIDQDGLPLADAVVVAVPVQGAPTAPPPAAREIVDQIDEEFVPRVKPVVVGTPVFFPNKDNIRHQVYSFSAAKRFELPLYAGTPAKPVVFDKPGVVVLGCNIHDWMIGYVYVSESPYFAKTGADGKALLGDLPALAYRVRVWHPRLQGQESATQQTADLGSNGRAELSWKLALKHEMRIRRAPVPGMRGHY
ncbi:MAG TPA: methylamine utilization protein [Burkholderiales bacterium]|nr:methylamine utilization protein [Burkholderiales bacterium]